jgi:WD40 repeat protein
VRVWDVASGEQQLLLEGFSNWVYGLAFSPDGARLAAADQDGLLLIWDAASGAEQARVKADSALNAVAFSPDGARLAVGADDGKVYFYGPDGAAQGDLTHGGQVSSVAYGPDGTLASAAYDGAVRLWAADGAPRAVLPLPSSVYALAFLPQARLAALSADSVIHVFPLELDALTAAAKGRLVREPSAAECKDYQLTDGCP